VEREIVSEHRLDTDWASAIFMLFLFALLLLLGVRDAIRLVHGIPFDERISWATGILLVYSGLFALRAPDRPVKLLFGIVALQTLVRLGWWLLYKSSIPKGFRLADLWVSVILYFAASIGIAWWFGTKWKHV